MSKIVLTFALFLAACAATTAEERRQQTENAVSEVWATMRPAGKPPPAVVFMQDGEIVAATNVVRRLPGQAPGAVYNCKSKTITINLANVRQDDVFTGLLVHELTHHKQCLQSRLLVENERLLEIEAYIAQVKWLNKRGDELGIVAGTDVRNAAARIIQFVRREFNADIE